jgi:hypothetical protein
MKKISKKLPLNHVVLFSGMLKAVIGQRLNSVKQAFSSGSPVTYNRILETDCEYTSVYYNAKEAKFKESGKMTISTVDVGGVERVALTAYDTNGGSIRVVLGDETGTNIIKQVSEYAIVDAYDLNLYRFGKETESALNKTLEYAGFDKILQAIYTQFPGLAPVKPQNNFGGGDGQKKGGFFKKPWQNNNNNNNYQGRSQEVTRSASAEPDADLFDL